MAVFGSLTTPAAARKLVSGFDRRVWVLLLAMVVFRFGQGLYFPFSAIHFHNVVGIPLSLVGVGLAALALASVASSLVSGPLSDRYGRKPLLLASLAGSTATFFAFAFVGGFAGYLVVSVAAGFVGSAMFDAARNAMVADVTAPGRRGRAYGLVRVGGNVGWALGPLVAGLTAAGAGTGDAYRLLFLGASAMVAVVAVGVALGVGESLPRPADAGAEAGADAPAEGPAAGSSSGLRAAFSDGSFVLLLAAGVLLYYVFTQNWQALPVYAKNFLGVSDGGIGLFLAANGVMVILFQLPISYLIDRHSKVGALLAGAALFAASSVTLLVTDSFWGILLAFAGFFTLAEMVLEVAGAALAADLAPEHQRGTYLALFGGCFGAAYGLSPVVSGALLEAGLPDLVWTVQLFAATFAAGALVLLGLRQSRLSRSTRPRRMA